LEEITMTAVDHNTTNRVRTADHALRERARKVIGNGMYGHLSVNRLPAEYPQFYERGQGARVWDVDGNEYVDLMCSFGPNILGHNHPKVMAAAQAQLAKGDTLSGPSAVVVDLAELLTERVGGTTWAMFAKNGTDANHIAVTIAKAQTGRKKILAATGAYHGCAPWCWLPSASGELDPDGREHMRYYTFNDLASVEAAVEQADGDVAGIIASPFKHDAGTDQEMTDPEFARGLRAICDRIGAPLIIDEVRAGFRMHHGGSWEPFGVTPDLSAWSKAIANGFALAAVLGNDSVRVGFSRIFTTGSFWFQAVPMAAAVATIHALRDEDAIGTMVGMGQKLRDGFESQAASHGVGIRQTGPVQMPNLAFDGDTGAYERANVFAAACVERGVIVHPRHNWFLCGAHTEADIDHVLAVSDVAFGAVRSQFGTS
jgi:glutamate-1-semialdehyde 2,1-aminomutase